MLAMISILVACTSAPKVAESAPGQIGYQFYSNWDSSSINHQDHIVTGLEGLFDRLDQKSRIFAAWSNLPSKDVQANICATLSRFPDSRLEIILDPAEFRIALADTNAKLPFLEHPQIEFQNREHPLAGILNMQVSDAHLKANLVLVSNLKPAGADDGKFSILFSTAPFSEEGRHLISESVRIYGDSSLYGRCMTYWEALRENQMQLGSVTSHTYSNLHDHQAWFFPDQLATTPEKALQILDDFELGIQQTRQPAKVRLALTGIDVCHGEFLDKLSRLSTEEEIDMKIVVCDSSTISRRATEVLQMLPEGSLRIFQRNDSTSELTMASRILLIDGPYPLIEQEPAAPQRITFLFGDDFDLTSQQSNSSLWLRIADRRLFQDAERHWNRLWEHSQEIRLVDAVEFNRQRRCPGR